MQSTTEEQPTPGGTPSGTAAEGAPGHTAERVAPLRGAGVEIDGRRLVRVVVGVCLVSLAILTVGLFVAGAEKNAQQTALTRNGVPVKVTVVNCEALLGGSGSNGAGYACTGTYTVDGKQYTRPIPGTALLAVGSTVDGVTVPGDPGLLSTTDIVAAQQPSWRVYILPTILLVVLVGLVVVVVLRIRRRPERPGPDPAASGAPGGSR